MELGALTPKMPEEIFPLEVWEMILNEVESPVDKSNCYRTCGVWRQLLEKKATSFLMAEVLPIISKYLNVEEEGQDSESDDSVTSSKSPDAILKLRLVCKSWKVAVDNHFQNYRTHTDVGFDTWNNGEDPDPFDLRPVRLGYAVYEFSVDNFEELEEFVQTFDPDTNHFISRYVTYDEACCHCERQREDRRVGRLRRQFTTFLGLHGRHIWHTVFGFHVWKDQFDTKRAYNLIRRYLQLLPNLRTLQIHFKIDDGLSINHSILRQTEPYLDKLLKRQPLPKLDHLTMLVMRNVPGLLEKGLLATNNHVQKLSLKSTPSESTPTAALPDFLCNLRMDNLEEWTISVNSENDLTTLQTLSWPVKSLRIHSHKVKLNSCFESVSTSRQSSTLKRLIVCPLLKEDIGKVSKKLDLPQLETFEMVVPARLRDIDFLLNCTSLVNLQLQMDVRKDEERPHSVTTRSMKRKKEATAAKSQIQFHGFATRMLESNIWTLLPGLKRLKIVKKVEKDPCDQVCCCNGPDLNFRIECSEFTRGEYDALQRTQN